MMAATAVATCPTCAAGLDRRETGKGVFWECTSCGGRGVGLGMLRQEISKKFLDKLWILSDEARFPRTRSCPHCSELMHEVLIPPPEGSIKIDVCRIDHFIWLDQGEFQRLPPPERGEQVAEPVLTPEAEEALLNAKAEAIADRKIRQEKLRSSVVGDWGDFLTFFYRLVRGDFG
jgi:Zn-finger nucleic acid-binding protein